SPGSNSRIFSARALPQASRLLWPCGLTTKVGTPAASAWARPGASVSAPTATMRAGYSGSAAASISAVRLLPPPEMSTTTFSTPPVYSALTEEELLVGWRERSLPEGGAGYCADADG